MQLARHPRALPLIAGIFAAVLEPVPPIAPSAWAAEHLVIADGPRAGAKWDPALTPYVAPIIDLLGPDSEANLVVCRKSAQTGLTEGGIALAGSYIDRAPCRIGWVWQSLDAISEFNRDKLLPSIEQTPVLKKKVRPQTSRSATGSNERNKRFDGGSLSLINGNSAKDLRSRTLKVGIADECDGWPHDFGDEGDPWDLLKGRFISFHATRDWRLFALSTPKVLGSSRIDTLYKAGDQRRWHVRCPQCDTKIVFEFKNLKFERKPPYKAHYVAQCCGRPIEHHEKASLVRAGEFIATNAEGLYPSFHVDALISLLTTWDMIADAWWSAQGDERNLRTFYNLWLGLPYEVRGDAPDHVRLLERREDYREGVVPARGLIFTIGADVQHSGIWYEAVAFAPNGESWTVRHEFLEGETTDPVGGAFAKLTAIYDRDWPDAFGGTRKPDAFLVDAGDGGRANQVYAWTRGRPRTFAIKGVPGWTAPAIGLPSQVDVNIDGRKIAKGAMLWPVGTWSLKAIWYANLRKLGRRAGQEIDPPGYVHFHEGIDERYCRMVTSESLATSVVKGRSVRIWKENGPNHLLDCRVYAMAGAEYLGLSRLTEAEWIEIARHRGFSAKQIETDLFAPDPLKIAAAAEIKPQPAPEGAAPAPARFDRASDWWGRR
jgi:phage terminase large subunit GpA-like protein